LGHHFDYGLGHGPGATLWIDNLDQAYGTLQHFKQWFQDPRFKKVWHNVGFDRHVMWNEGIDVLGFGGNTMHMARLQDIFRTRYGNGAGYSLKAFTHHILDDRKRPIKEIFGVNRLKKDGTQGAILNLPPVQVLQRHPDSRNQWIVYSAFDAESTWRLRQRLQHILEDMPWFQHHNLYQYYQMHMCRFGHVLTNMERRGVHVDAQFYLNKVKLHARQDWHRHVTAFTRRAATQIGPNGHAMNPASSTQLCTFLFGGTANAKTNRPTKHLRVFKVLAEDSPDEALRLLDQQ